MQFKFTNIGEKKSIFKIIDGITPTSSCEFDGTSVLLQLSK